VRSFFAGVPFVHIHFRLNSSNTGNKVEAYGGTISFTLGHSEYNSLGLGAQVLIMTFWGRDFNPNFEFSAQVKK
jgi:hypothetical protein